MAVTINIDVDGNVIVKNLSAEDQLALENDLLDVGDWIDKAIDGKISNARKRMVRAGIIDLRKEGIRVPADDDTLITTVVAQPDYKNRKDRDADSRN